MKVYQKEIEYTDEEMIERLDEIYGEVDICGMTYSSGQALKELDPTAFRFVKLDMADADSRDNPIYVCGECETEYDNEEEAESCCQPDKN